MWKSTFAHNRPAVVAQRLRARTLLDASRRSPVRLLSCAASRPTGGTGGCRRGWESLPYTTGVEPGTFTSRPAKPAPLTSGPQLLADLRRLRLLGADARGFRSSGFTRFPAGRQRPRLVFAAEDPSCSPRVLEFLFGFAAHGPDLGQRWRPSGSAGDESEHLADFFAAVATQSGAASAGLTGPHLVGRDQPASPGVAGVARRVGRRNGAAAGRRPCGVLAASCLSARL